MVHQNDSEALSNTIAQNEFHDVRFVERGFKTSKTRRVHGWGRPLIAGIVLGLAGAMLWRTSAVTFSGVIRQCVAGVLVGCGLLEIIIGGVRAAAATAAPPMIPTLSLHKEQGPAEVIEYENELERDQSYVAINTYLDEREMAGKVWR